MKKEILNISTGLLVTCCFLLMSQPLYSQIAINQDGSSPAAHSILTVKGSGGNYFFIDDTSGHVGINTLGPLAGLTVNGPLKLDSPGNGSTSDFLSMWSPGQGHLLKVNPSQIASGPEVFHYESNLISNSPGTLWQDDFVFGSDQLDDDGIPGHYARFFLDKEKGAFRAGYTDNLNWNHDSLGNYSIGFGYNVLARAEGAIAIGKQTSAIGTRSHAFGDQSQATGFQGLAFGKDTRSTWIYAVAMGDSTGAEAAAGERSDSPR